jgi:NitT/TauT family transport system substrate-binding protein
MSRSAVLHFAEGPALAGTARHFLMLIAGVMLAVCCALAHADEVKKVVIARQPGIQFLPLIVMQGEGLFDKELKAANLHDTEVAWQEFAGGGDTNTAVLSGAVQLAASGVPPFLTLWDKSNGAVKAVAALSSYRFYLNTRNPNVKQVRDLSSADRISLPGVKVSMGAVVLQMMAAKAFGPENYDKLDPLTVSLSFPDGMAALLNPRSEINSAFASPPYYYHELRAPGVHKVSDSYDVLGPATTNLVFATQQFHDSNPHTYAAFLRAMTAAMAIIKTDKRHAAEIYLRVSNDKRTTMGEMMAMLNDPEIIFTEVPFNSVKWADFMYSIKTLKKRPVSWRDFFFPELQSQAGS